MLKKETIKRILNFTLEEVEESKSYKKIILNNTELKKGQYEKYITFYK